MKGNKIVSYNYVTVHVGHYSDVSDAAIVVRVRNEDSVFFGSHMQVRSYLENKIVELFSGKQIVVVKSQASFLKKLVLPSSLKNNVAFVEPYDFDTNKTVNMLQILASEKFLESKGSPEHVVPLMNNEVAEVYTDASVAANRQGSATCGWVRKNAWQDNKKVKFSVSKSSGTVLDNEIKAIVFALTEHKGYGTVNVYSDSDRAVQIVTSYLNGNQNVIRHGILSISEMDAFNRAVFTPKKKRSLNIYWVKAHVDNEWNNVADQMVKYARYLYNSLKVTSEEQVKVMCEEMVVEHMKNKNIFA